MAISNSDQHYHLVDAATMADILGVSERTIRNWKHERKIPFRKVGRSLRFAPDEVIAAKVVQVPAEVE